MTVSYIFNFLCMYYLPTYTISIKFKHNRRNRVSNDFDYFCLNIAFEILENVLILFHENLKLAVPTRIYYTS